MKFTKLLPIIAFAFALFAMTACNKNCQDCKAPNSVTVEICESDFPSEEDYEDYITTFELAGGECN